LAILFARYFEKKGYFSMKVLHLNAGNETGGGMVHILSLLSEFNRDEMVLGLFEKSVMYYEAEKLGIKVKCFEQKSKYDLSVLKKVANYIENEKFDIVHTHGARANLFACILKKFMKCRYKWVTTIHSDPREDFIGCGLKGRVLTNIHLFALKSPDHYFAISKRFKDMLIGMGINESRITTIYNGIRFEQPCHPVVDRKEIGLHTDDFVLIMIARLHPIKGHIIAFEAIKRLSAKYSNLKLLLVGSGTLMEKLKQKTRELNIEDQVIFLGHQKHVHGFLSIADVKVLTSYSESFPLVILEAARAKTPVISTDVGGVKDLISSPSLGWVIPPKDVTALEHAIEEAIARKKDGTLKEIGKRLYEKASREYSIQHLTESIYHTYKKLQGF
jgi:glycosyltransferase involved in cell wall biosynthesis